MQLTWTLISLGQVSSAVSIHNNLITELMPETGPNSEYTKNESSSGQ